MRDSIHRYDDIIHLTHPEPRTRPRMPLADRAAQFSPFAALTGYGPAIQEAARRTEARIELTEDERAELDRKLALLLEHLSESPQITVTYFIPDAQKEGGSYAAKSGRIKKIDANARVLILSDQTKIPLDDIYDMDLQNIYCVRPAKVLE